MTSSQRLVLIGNFVPDRQESMQRFAQLLADGMSSRGWQVETWKPEPRFTRWVRTYRYGGIPKYLGYLDKFFVFPKELQRRRRSGSRDVVYHIADHSNAVYARHLPSDRLLVTCHDLLQIRSALGEFPQNPVSSTGQRYQRWILASLSQLKRVACVSEKTSKDLRRLAKLPPEAVSTIYLGLNYPFRPMPRIEAERLLNQACARSGISSAEQIFAEPGGCWLGVGGAQWYKNRTGLVSIFAELQRRTPASSRLLYIGPPFDPDQEAILTDQRLLDRVIRLSGVSGEELRAAYSLALGLLFPSWEEGFGWPIVEAQACGCPVFTSNREPMTEIGGSAACFVDPANPPSAADAIVQALPDRARMSAEGLRGAARWDMGRMLAEYERLYLSLVKEQTKFAAVGS